MSKLNILKGITWLTVGAIIAKICGGIYKILLTRILGVENIGLFSQLLPVYTFFIMLTTSGVPLGVSKLLSSKTDINEKKKSFKNTLKVFLFLSIILSVILIVLNRKIAILQQNPKLGVCYVLIAPAIVFSAVSAVLKGYYQSFSDFKPSSVTQVIEQIVKIVFGLTLSLIFVHSSTLIQIIGAVLGVVFGDLVVFVVLMIKYKKQNSLELDFKFNKKETKELFRIIFPIMLSSLVIPFSQFIDSFLVIKLLNKNFNNGISTYLYGLQTGVVSALSNLPTVITFAIATVLLPNLTADFVAKNETSFSKKVSTALNVILIIVVPSVLFMMLFPNQIINFLYEGKLNGYMINGEILTAKLLFWSSLNIVFLSLSQFLSICLQAREKRYLPVVNNAIGMLVKLVLEIVFIPSVKINILAFTLANLVGYFTIFCLNLYEIIKENVIKIKKIFWLKLLIVNVLTFTIAVFLVAINMNKFAFFLSSLLIVCIYFALLWGVKIFSSKDILQILKKDDLKE